MKLIDKDYLIQYLTGMANAECCDDNTERIIKKYIIPHINTIEVKEVNEIPASIEINRYGNRFISTWSGLCQYDNFKIGDEIVILLPTNVKAQKGE